MKQFNTVGIVLGRVNYGESDRILSVLTEDYGKIQLIAKGIRKSNSKLAGSVELFSETNLSYIKGKGEINTLVSARLIKHYDNIIKDLAKTQWAYSVLKLVNSSIETSSGEDLYELLKETLIALDNDKIALDIIETWFILNFLNILGHGLNLSVSQKVDNYRFDLSNMSFNPDSNGQFSINVIKLFRLMISNKAGDLIKIKGIDQLITDTKKLVQSVMLTNGFNL